MVAALAHAQVPTNVQKDSSGNITGSLNIGAGKTFSVNGGTVNGSGTFDFSSATINLPPSFTLGSGTGLLYLTGGSTSTITTIPSGTTWNGIVIGSSYGGAGSVSGVLKANGSGVVSQASASDIGLGSVTNDAQTKAAVMPNTAPAAGQIAVGNAGGTAYAPVSLSGDATLASTGAITLTNGNATRTNIGVYPIGTVANAALDSGTWLQMNGQVVSQSTYATLFGIIGHVPEFNWTESPAFAGTMSHVCFGNSTYVLVGVSGEIYTSSNLSSWASQTSGVGTQLNAVTWDPTNSLFVTVGASNVLLTSPTGVTWTSRTSGVTSTLSNVLSANGEIVSVGSAGWITYSTNGTSWTATQPNSAPSLSYLFYQNSTWFSCPQTHFSTGIVYSTNGTTWNYIAKPTTNDAIFLGFDSTYFYLIDNTTYEIWRSTTGASWTDTGISLNNLGPATVILSGGKLLNAGSFTSNGWSSISTIKNNVTVAYTSILCNPLGNSSQKFVLFGSSGSIETTYDCSILNEDSSKQWMGVSTNESVYLPHYYNGYYFILVFPNANHFLYAPDPYNPSTQFQIPTRLNSAGGNLYIKSLN